MMRFMGTCVYSQCGINYLKAEMPQSRAVGTSLYPSYTFIPQMPYPVFVEYTSYIPHPNIHGKCNLVV